MMKRLLSFLLASFIIINMLCLNVFAENTDNASSNPVINPGFENDDSEVKIPAGWSSYDLGNDYGFPYGENLVKMGDDAHSGTYYGRHYKNARYIINTYQDFYGLQNGKYKLEAWVRSSGGQYEASIIARFGAEATPTQLYDAIPTTDVWTKIEINDIEVSTGYAHIQFFSNAEANQWIEFDDVTLYKVVENKPPILAEIGNKTAYTNEQLSFKIEVVDISGVDVVTYSAIGLPEGAVLDPETGVFSWTPTDTQKGMYSITFQAENTKGESNSKTINIAVRSPIPKINQISNPGFEADKAEVKTPSGWETYAWTAGYNENHVKSGDAHSGSYYGRHYAAEDYSVTTYKVFNGLENGKYKLEAWVRSSGGQNVADLLAIFGDTTGPGKKEHACNIPKTNVWTKIEIDDIEVSAGFAQIQFISFAKANQWIEFDDVMFYKTDMGLLEKVSDRDAYVNEPIEIKIAGAYVDEEVDTVTYSAIGLPTGAVLDSKTGIFNWMPEIDDIGDHSITFEAVDVMGKSDSRIVKITVYKERTEVGIRNSGFEELDENGVPTGGWHAFGGWGSGFAAVEKTTVYEGQNSIRLGKGSEVNDPVWYRYILSDVKPGALYEVSAMINYNLESGGGPGFTILVEGYSGETADAAADYLQGDYPPYIGGNTNNQWVKYGGTIQAHNDAKTLVIYLFLNAPGTVYIDNVSLKLSGDGPEPYFFTTDQVFYYTDDKQGISHVEIDRYYKAEDEPYTATVDFELLDGAEVLKSQKDTKFDKGSKTEFVFDMALLSEKGKQYAIKAVVKKSTGEVIRTYTSEIYKYDRPTRLLADGTYLKDGKPYYPSIAYWPIDDYAKMKEVGINCIELGAYSMEQTMEALDRLQELDMTAIVSLFCGPAWMEPAGHPDNITFTKEIVNAIKDHPAVFAYATMDEPLGAGLREERVQQMITSYKIIREIDKVHPIYVIDFKPSLYKESQKYCDIWAVDIYTYGDTSAVSSMGREGVEAAAGRKPTYWIGQTYKSNSYGVPNIKDVRSGIYRAFEVGIKGIGYYTIKTAIGQFGGEASVDLPDTHLWEPMVKFAQNEQEELFNYFVGKKYQTFNKHDDGELRSFYYESWMHGEDIWVIAHNRGNSTIDAQVPLSSDDGLVTVRDAKAKAIGGTENDLDIKDGTLSVKMGPQEVYLYKVTPSSNTDPVSQYKINVLSDGNGTASANITSAEAGTEITLTAVANSGYRFKEWQVIDGGVTVANNKFIMPDADVKVNAIFEQIPTDPVKPEEPGNTTQPPVQTDPIVLEDGITKTRIDAILESGKKAGVAAISKETLDKMFTQSKENADGTKKVIIEVPEVKDAEAYIAKFSEGALSEEDGNKFIEIRTTDATLVVPMNMLAGEKEKGNIELSIGMADKTDITEGIRKMIGERPVIDLNLSVGGNTVNWNNPKAPVIVSLKYNPDNKELKKHEHISVWYIDGNGKVNTIPNGRYNPDTGMVTFTAKHFSKYAIAFVEKNFNDLAGYSWAKNCIEVMASKGIISGTTATSFNPGAAISRADFITLLVNVLELDAEFRSNFTDVKVGEYYYEAVGIAKELGITAGTGNNMFDPKAPITRQDMMILVTKALKVAGKPDLKGTMNDIKSYSDASKVSSYAVESVAGLVKAGIVSGYGSMIDPSGKTARAQAASIIYKLYNLED